MRGWFQEKDQVCRAGMTMERGSGLVHNMKQSINWNQAFKSRSLFYMSYEYHRSAHLGSSDNTLWKRSDRPTLQTVNNTTCLQGMRSIRSENIHASLQPLQTSSVKSREISIDNFLWLSDWMGRQFVALYTPRLEKGTIIKSPVYWKWSKWGWRADFGCEKKKVCFETLFTIGFNEDLFFEFVFYNVGYETQHWKF